jgi:hypothetical protein
VQKGGGSSFGKDLVLCCFYTFNKSADVLLEE